MIVLRRTYPDPFADEVEEQLKDLVLAHRVVAAGERDDAASDGVTITQSGRTYRGRKEVGRFIDELTREVLTGRQFQSDACYLDPDDPSRCL